VSTLDELRALHDEALNEQTIELPVTPAQYRGAVWIRYSVPKERETLEGILAAAVTGTVLSRDADADLVIACARELLRRTGDGEFVPFFDDDRPFRFNREDKRLAQWLDTELITEREQVRALFITDRFPIAISGHFDRLLGWLQGVRDEARERVEEAGKEDGSASSS
jgi:hypothetical protein